MGAKKTVGRYLEPGFGVAAGLIIRFVGNSSGIEATWDFETAVHWIVAREAVWVGAESGGGSGGGGGWHWPPSKNPYELLPRGDQLSDVDVLYMLERLMEETANREEG